VKIQIKDLISHPYHGLGRRKIVLGQKKRRHGLGVELRKCRKIAQSHATDVNARTIAKNFI
jgi:hypothetical protein